MALIQEKKGGQGNVIRPFPITEYRLEMTKRGFTKNVKVWGGGGGVDFAY